MCRDAEEPKRGKGGKFKLPAAFKRPGSRGAAAGPEPDATSPSSSAQGAALGFDPVAAMGEFYGGSGPPSPDPWAGPPSPDARPGGGGSQVPGGANTAGGALLSEADLIDYPFLIDGDPTPAAYLLLACADYLRLYPAGGWFVWLGWAAVGCDWPLGGVGCTVWLLGRSGACTLHGQLEAAALHAGHPTLP